MQTFILLYALNRGFFDFCKEKIFSTFYKQLLFNRLQNLLARGRSIFAKGLFWETSKNFFAKSFGDWKNGFIIVMYSKAKQTADKYGEKRTKK